ncbi:MAG TPA: arginine deiminase family protein [Thermomicrobiales bacterium]|nr:arginine deiminase family protein [Thermomicrobiales bacterium]
MPTPPEGQISKSDAYYHVVLERIPPRAEPPFEDAAMQERVWGRQWGVGDDVGRLRLVALHRPGDEMRTIDPDKYDETIEALIDDREQWYWRDSTGPDIDLMQRQHDALRAALEAEGVEIVEVGGSDGDVKAVFTRDQAIAVDGGAVICRMGPVGADPGYGRRGEEGYITKVIANLGMPILRTIHGTGLIEGGSFCFLKPGVAALGMSFRQNEEGARQVEEVLRATGTRLIRIPLTGHSLHLDGCILMVSHDQALINVTRLPYWFLDELTALGIEPIHCWPNEGHAVNCLAIRPGKVLISEGCPWTVERLNQRGIETVELDYSEIRKNGGGIHCSTLPLIRDRM